jgi:hypothetical protein
MARRMRAARSAESFPATPPGRRSRRSAWRRLSALVRSATRSSRLSESRRIASEADSGSTRARRSLREAASAVARASSSSFLRAFPFDVVVYDGCPLRTSCERASGRVVWL